MQLARLRRPLTSSSRLLLGGLHGCHVPRHWPLRTVHSVSASGRVPHKGALRHRPGAECTNLSTQGTIKCIQLTCAPAWCRCLTSCCAYSHGFQVRWPADEAEHASPFVLLVPSAKQSLCAEAATGVCRANLCSVPPGHSTDAGAHTDGCFVHLLLPRISKQQTQKPVQQELTVVLQDDAVTNPLLT